MTNDSDLAQKQLAQRTASAPARAVANAPRQTSTVVADDGQVKRKWLMGDPFDSPRFYFEEPSTR